MAQCEMTHDTVETAYVFILRVRCSVWDGVGASLHMTEIRVQGLVWGIRPGICAVCGNMVASCLIQAQSLGCDYAAGGHVTEKRFYKFEEVRVVILVP